MSVYLAKCGWFIIWGWIGYRTLLASQLVPGVQRSAKVKIDAFTSIVLLLVTEASVQQRMLRLFFRNLEYRPFSFSHDWLSIVLYALLVWIQWTLLEHLLTRQLQWEQFSCFGTDWSSRCWRAAGCLVGAAIDWTGHLYLK